MQTLDLEYLSDDFEHAAKNVARIQDAYKQACEFQVLASSCQTTPNRNCVECGNCAGTQRCLNKQIVVAGKRCAQLLKELNAAKEYRTMCYDAYVQLKGL